MLVEHPLDLGVVRVQLLLHLLHLLVEVRQLRVQLLHLCTTGPFHAGTREEAEEAEEEAEEAD